MWYLLKIFQKQRVGHIESEAIVSSHSNLQQASVRAAGT